MKYLLIILFVFQCTTILFGQKIKTDQGDIDAIEGINEYNIVFEYASDLQIPNYNSEKGFLQFQSSKRERNKTGSGKEFRKLWFENREQIYEPKFIEKFNAFKLKKRQIKVGKDITSATYTMVVKIFLIYPGYDISVFEEEAKLDISISIYKNTEPEDFIYVTKKFTIHGKGESHNEYERVMTAYSELGTWTSKYFCRKT